ncbi:MAG TPA: hypothetical protein VM032_11825 [Vicinamibacterales bacterium]|nr:hypothetical protein [Vicinamibacterales bacterium]
MQSSSRRRGKAPPDPVPSSLPPLYTPWIADALGGLPPSEHTATCGSCAMLAPRDHASPAAASPDAVFFDPRSKCCTYIPWLPNFLVGRALLDADPGAADGRASVLARIAAGHQVTPLGLEKPPTFVALYGLAASEVFGRAVDLRCPHYLTDTGGCGVWKHRMSVCATWFCKHDRGEVGMNGWTAVRHLLEAIERALAVHCVRELAPGAEALRHAGNRDADTRHAVKAPDLGGTPDTAAARRLWGRFAGREIAFYEACARLVEPLSWADLRRIGGVEIDVAADLAREAFGQLCSLDVPPTLWMGPLHVLRSDADAVECTTYSAFDPLSIPRALFDVLPVFDGRPTRKALAAAREAGVPIGQHVVRRLVDHAILISR